MGQAPMYRQPAYGQHLQYHWTEIKKNIENISVVLTSKITLIHDSCSQGLLRALNAIMIYAQCPQRTSVTCSVQYNSDTRGKNSVLSQCLIIIIIIIIIIIVITIVIFIVVFVVIINVIVVVVVVVVVVVIIIIIIIIIYHRLVVSELK